MTKTCIRQSLNRNQPIFLFAAPAIGRLKYLIFLLLPLYASLMIGCVTHYIVNVQGDQNMTLSKYRTFDIRGIKRSGLADAESESIVSKTLASKLCNAGFALALDAAAADADIDIEILRYLSESKRNPGRSAVDIPAHWKDDGRYVPEHMVGGIPSSYVESGDVMISLKIFDSKTHQQIWTALAHGKGIPSDIVDNVVAELVECIKLSSSGKDWQGLKRK